MALEVAWVSAPTAKSVSSSAGPEGKGSQTVPGVRQNGSKREWADGARDPGQVQHLGQDLPNHDHQPSAQHHQHHHAHCPGAPPALLSKHFNARAIPPHGE